MADWEVVSPARAPSGPSKLPPEEQGWEPVAPKAEGGSVFPLSSFGEPVTAAPQPLRAGPEMAMPRDVRFAESGGGAATGLIRAPGRRPQTQQLSPGEFAARAVGTAAQISDMFTSTGKMLLGAAPYWAARTAVQAKTGDPALAAQVAQETKDWFFPPEISTPWARVAERLGPQAQAAYSDNPVGWVMEKIGDYIQHGSQTAAAKTGLQPQDFTALADQVMGSLGFKAVKPAVQQAFRERFRAETGREPTPPRSAAEEPPAKPRVRWDTAAGEWREVAPRAAAGAVVAGGVAAAAMDEDYRDLIAPGLGVGAALAVKGKGGMWHPEAVERLAASMEGTLLGRLASGEAESIRTFGAKLPPEELAKLAPEERAKVLRVKWLDKSIRTYLNRHAGTATDPLKDIKIPMAGEAATWENLTDKVIQKAPAKYFSDIKNVPLDEPIHTLELDISNRMRAESAPVTESRLEASRLLKGYLSHVGDYLRQNVDPAKLQQYDLVRAVKETAANDARVAKEMEKAQAADMAQMPVYREYPQGFKWVELRLPEKLTEEQARSVKNAYEILESGQGLGDTRYDYVALDASGKPVKNSYTGDIATGNTPEEAWLSGQLAREGNAMGHCVGGYCEGVASGESRIFSLRDAKGGSHVTVEVTPHYSRASDLMADDLYNENRVWNLARQRDIQMDSAGRYTIRDEGKIGRRFISPEEHRQLILEANPELAAKEAATPPDVAQIKGKQNRAPNAEYLPFVQDFVKSGKWGEVGDLENTGLQRYQGKFYTEVEAEKLLKDTFKALPEEGKQLGVVAETIAQWDAGARDLERLMSRLDYGRHQRGSVDPRLLGRLGLGAAGAAAGAALSPDEPWKGGAAGALAGFLAPRAGRAVFDAARAALQPGGLGARLERAAGELVPGPISAAFAADTSRIRIKSQMDAADTFVRRAELARTRLINNIVGLVPEAARREAISHWLEGDKSVRLSPVEHSAALSARKFFDQWGKLGTESGVLKGLLDSYVTHVYGRDAIPFLDQLLAERRGGSTTTGFAKERTGPPTLEQVNAWMRRQGRPPIVTDIAQILDAYGNSLAKAVANKQLVETLKATKTSVLRGGEAKSVPLVMRAGFKGVPGTYQSFGHEGYLAHPDIIPALRFLFQSSDSVSWVRGVEALNTAAKRSAVMLSLFHAKNLVDAFAGSGKLSAAGLAGGAAAGAAFGAGTGQDPITYAMIGAGLGMAAGGGKIAAQAAFPKLFGENKYVKALRRNDPAMAKIIDLSFQAGLRYALPRGELAVEEAGGGIYAGLRAAQQYLDGLPRAKPVLRGAEAANRAMDGFLWERLHTGMKLAMFAEKYETLVQNNAAAAARGRATLLSELQLAEKAASYVNDIFGGLDWRRVAEEAKTRWGRDLAMGAYSPQGRRVLQLAFFAPDWTLSTLRAAAKAAGRAVGQEKGTGLRGLFKPENATDLHRQYVLRSAFYYALVGDGLNMALTGHHLWQNSDPTYIETGDGRKIQYSKHTMEPYHWLMRPVQTGLNKMGQIPRELLNQMFGTEYLAPRKPAGGQVVAGPEMRGSRLGHAARTFLPFGVQQLAEGGAQAGLAGAAGMPIYGKTKEEQEKERGRRAEQRRRQRLQKELGR